MNRLTNAQLLFIVVAAFNAIAAGVQFYRGEVAGLMNLFVACCLLITARGAA